MTDIHTYIPGDNGCQARVRVPSTVGSRPSTTSMWCGLPERSPYHQDTSRDWKAWSDSRHFHDDECYTNGCDMRSGQLIETRANSGEAEDPQHSHPQVHAHGCFDRGPDEPCACTA